MAFPIANNSDITEAVYIGYFGRAGDPSGDAYWVGKLNSGAISISGMTESFSVQPETTNLYPFFASQAPGTAETIKSSNGWSLSVPTLIFITSSTASMRTFLIAASLPTPAAWA